MSYVRKKKHPNQIQMFTFRYVFFIIILLYIIILLLKYDSRTPVKREFYNKYTSFKTRRKTGPSWIHMYYYYHGKSKKKINTHDYRERRTGIDLC